MRRREGEVRARLRGRVGQGHEPRSLRPGLIDVVWLVTGSTASRSPKPGCPSAAGASTAVLSSKRVDSLRPKTPRAARPARRLPVPRRARARDLRRQGEVDPQARRLALLQPERATAATDARRRDRPRSSASSSPPRPRRCSPSRASSSSTGRASTSACATTSPTRSSRSRSTRTSRASTSRASATAATAPTSARTRTPSACAATLEVLGKIFHVPLLHGPRAGPRAAAVPCLDYYIKRCGAPCVGYVSQEEYRRGHRRRDRLPLGPLREIERDLEQRMMRRGRGRGVRAGDARAQPPAGRALAARAPARRRTRRSARSTRSPSRVDGHEANAQVFQVRDGVLSDRQSFYLANETERGRRRGGRGVHAAVLRGRDRRSRRCWSSQRELGERRCARQSARRAPRRPGRDARRRARRQAAHPRARRAQRAAGARPGAAAVRAPAPAAASRRSTGCSGALGLDAPPMRIECFDISHLGGTHTVASMVVFEGGAPKKSDYRRFTDPRRSSGSPTTSRRWRRCSRGASRSGSARRDISPHDPDYDASFAALPNLVVIDGGKGQLAAGLGAAARLSRARRRGRLAGQAHRGGLPAGPPRRRSCCHTTRPSCSCCSACATRRTASRSPTTACRRDKAMTGSLLDELPGVGRRASGRCSHTSARPTPCSRPAARSCGGARPARQAGARAVPRIAQERRLRTRPQSSACDSTRWTPTRAPRFIPARRFRRHVGGSPDTGGRMDETQLPTSRDTGRAWQARGGMTKVTKPKQGGVNGGCTTPTDECRPKAL